MTDRELLEENNKMLKEILSFVRKVDSAEYRDHQDFMEFLRNVAADIWVEYTEPEQRSKLFNLINKDCRYATARGYAPRAAPLTTVMFLQPVIYFGRAFPNWRARVIPAIAISGFLAFVSKNPICFSDGSVSS